MFCIMIPQLTLYFYPLSLLKSPFSFDVLYHDSWTHLVFLSPELARESVYIWCFVSWFLDSPCISFPWTGYRVRLHLMFCIMIRRLTLYFFPLSWLKSQFTFDVLYHNSSTHLVFLSSELTEQTLLLGLGEGHRIKLLLLPVLQPTGVDPRELPVIAGTRPLHQLHVTVLQPVSEIAQA